MDLKAALGLDASPDVENTVHFELYREGGDTQPADLDSLQTDVMQHVLQYIHGYIWQRDRFQTQSNAQLSPPWQHAQQSKTSGTAQGNSAPPGLWGSVCFGDNLEDEWFIVWLLMQITQHFADITARVWDNDGEFLLIEAAYALPRWLKPETAANRVWLRAGMVHLVPLPSATNPTLPPSPTPSEGLAIVCSGGVKTVATSGLQALIQTRVAGYPEAAGKAMHRARAILPLKVAAILRAEPQLVAPAVEAFHYRDVDDMKAAGRMRNFPPEEMVTSSVIFSRCLYAQLAQQSFQPPASYPLPRPGAPSAAAADLGMKLTLGMEMMYCNRSRFASAPESGVLCADLVANPAWAAYLSSLQRSGYFGGNIEGSAAHRKLLATAEDNFRASEAYQRSTLELAAPACRIDALLELPMSAEEFKEVGPEDDSAWLAEGAAELDAHLAARQAELDSAQQRSGARQPADDGGDEGDFDADVMAKQMKAFVGKMSSFEGAEVGENGLESLDAGRFWAELSSSLGIAAGSRQQASRGADRDDSPPHDEGESSSESDGFYSDQEDANDDDQMNSEGHTSARDDGAGGAAAVAGTLPMDGHAREATLGAGQMPSSWGGLRVVSEGAEPGGNTGEDAWEAATATDSDDEEGDVSDTEFMTEYDRALQHELRGTKIAESFERVPGASAEQPSEEGGDNSQADDTTEEQGIGGDMNGSDDEGMRPVDVDLNLISSLLESFSSQQGMPGPASNLAGLLGLELPHDNKEG